MFEVSSLQNVMTRVPAAQRPHNTTVSCVNRGCYGGMDSVYPGVDPTSTRMGASVGVRGLKAICHNILVYIEIMTSFLKFKKKDLLKGEFHSERLYYPLDL